MPRQSWEAALVAAATLSLATGACQELTDIGPQRLPPPKVDVVNEGDFSQPFDRCGTMLVSTPVRLSATLGNSTAPAIAVIGTTSGAPRVLVAWLEPDEPSHRVHARQLSTDGSFIGPLARLDADDPTSVSIAPLEALGSFVVGIAEEGDLHLIPLVADTLYRPYTGGLPPQPGTQPGVQGRWVEPGLSQPRIVPLPDRVLVAALGPDEDGDGEADSIHLLDATVDPSLPTPCDEASPVAARAVDIQPDGAGARVAWIHDGELYGARISSECSCVERDQCSEPPWQLPTDARAARRNEGIVGTRLRSAAVRGRLSVVVAREDSGAIWVQDSRGDWATVRSLGPDPHGTASFAPNPWEAQDFALGVEPVGRRLVLARPVSARATEATEIELQRSGGDSFVPCAPPTSCIQLSADQRWSFEPEMAALSDGFAVVWTDAEEPEGPRDVYYARVTCATEATN